MIVKIMGDEGESSKKLVMPEPQVFRHLDHMLQQAASTLQNALLMGGDLHLGWSRKIYDAFDRTLQEQVAELARVNGVKLDFFGSDYQVKVKPLRDVFGGYTAHIMVANSVLDCVNGGRPDPNSAIVAGLGVDDARMAIIRSLKGEDIGYSLSELVGLLVQTGSYEQLSRAMDPRHYHHEAYDL